MTPEEISKLTPGIYRVYWKGGDLYGVSHAAIGVNSDGRPWLAPTNWSMVDSDTELSYTFGRVERVEKIDIPEKGEAATDAGKSDTPRTDAEARGIIRSFGEMMVPVDFARTLERENNELRAEVEREKQRAETNAQRANEFTYEVMRLGKETKELRSEIERLRNPAVPVKPPEAAPDVLDLFEKNLHAAYRYLSTLFVGDRGPTDQILLTMDALKLAREGKEWKPAITG